MIMELCFSALNKLANESSRIWLQWKKNVLSSFSDYSNFPLATGTMILIKSETETQMNILMAAYFYTHFTFNVDGVNWEIRMEKFIPTSHPPELDILIDITTCRYKRRKHRGRWLGLFDEMAMSRWQREAFLFLQQTRSFRGLNSVGLAGTGVSGAAGNTNWPASSSWLNSMSNTSTFPYYFHFVQHRQWHIRGTRCRKAQALDEDGASTWMSAIFRAAANFPHWRFVLCNWCNGKHKLHWGKSQPFDFPQPSPSREHPLWFWYFAMLP